MFHAAAKSPVTAPLIIPADILAFEELEVVLPNVFPVS